MRKRESQGTGPQDKNQLRRGPQGCWGWASPGGSRLEWHRALQQAPGVWVLDLQCLSAGQGEEESLAASSGTKGQVTRTGPYPHTLLQPAWMGVEERCPVSSYNKGKSWVCSARGKRRIQNTLHFGNICNRRCLRKDRQRHYRNNTKPEETHLHTCRGSVMLGRHLITRNSALSVSQLVSRGRMGG